MNRIILASAAILVVAWSALNPRLAADGPRIHDDEDDQGRSAKVAAAARQIDRLVLKRLGKEGIAPESRVDDATFVRRSYLAIVGRIPNAKETEKFLASSKTDKRMTLVNALLASEGHVSHMFSFWADLLRIKSRLPGGVSGEPYVDWVKTSIAENLPYDQFVAKLLLSDGPAYARGNGATGYFLRDRGMLADNMANTVRIFLGTRLECAQCHNHPFDKWTQLDFYRMAAFTGGLRFNHELSLSVEGKRLLEMRKKLGKDKGREAVRAFDQMVGPLRAGLRGDGNGKARLPRDYQYEDAKPNQTVKANPIFSDRPKTPGPIAVGKDRANAIGDGSRAEYAQWLTSPDNPRFTTVIANRLWKRVMGAALIEPLDIITDATKPTDPELMNFLEKLMRDLDYDLMAFQRVLFNTSTFRRRAALDVRATDGSPLFPGPRLTRMSAEQIWDSMLTLVIDDIDDPVPGDAEERAEDVYRQYDALTRMKAKDVEGQVGMAMMRRMDRKAYDSMMSRMEAESVKKDKIKARESRTTLRELRKARERGDEKTEATLIARLKKRGVNVPPRPVEGKERDFMRAADLPSPSVPGHALRQFGQSDRDQIDASNDEASIPQILMLLNGFIEDAVIGSEDSAIMKRIAAQRSVGDRIRVVYLSILNREPTKEERDLWRRDARQHGETIWRDLVWSLLNTHEFMFVQ